ncbi:MAG TPA: efflux RND transporter periplasmic adaptor subunit, partial [Flavitalea sp.]|nr:efflux RND transporter periplasmic adaptor subunit [Flavitalea sp.]
MKLNRSLSKLLIVLLLLAGCTNRPAGKEEAMMYTCPMPEDSVFSDKPGKCPKCGMELIEVQHQHAFSATYTCPMHPEIVRESPGQCPVCGMELVKKESADDLNDPQLHTVLRSQDAAVSTSLPVTTIADFSGEFHTELYGTVGYDPRQLGVVSSFVTGRIEKLYVRYRFQPVEKGQALMEVYSPELLTAQQELLFLLKSDATNYSLINAAKQKLQQLGMSSMQVNSVIQKQEPRNTITVYSGYAGHIHDAGNMEPTSGMTTDESGKAELTV